MTPTHRSPPQGIGIGGKILVEFFLHQINQERGEDEHQETDVPGSHQLLQHAPTQYRRSHAFSVRISEPAPPDVFSTRYFAVICSIDEHFIYHHGNL